MSCDGVTIGSPDFGCKILLDPSIRSLASAWASSDNGTWTAIWSPSKSALNAVHTNGCKRIALPPTKIGSNAWIPNLCSVGARFNNTGCSLITSSTISQTCGSRLSINLLAALILWAISLSTKPLITCGLNNSRAISFGIPHWYILSDGPTTITLRPE